MKNKILVLLFAFGGLLSSCSDAYDIPEKGTIYDQYEAFRTAEDVKRGLNTIYRSIPANTEIALGSIFTDEISIGLDNGNQGLISGEYGFMMESNNGYATSLWDSYYAMLNRINRLEVISNKLISNTKSTEEISKHKDNLSNLYILRAFAHYKLFAYFTPDYTNPSGLSAIILDHVPPYDYNYALERNTVGEVKKFILDDLDKAISVNQTGFTENPDYVNLATIDAIRVKLYSMTQDWDKVIESGERIMLKYKLAKALKYEKMFARVAPEANTSNGLDLVFEEPGNTTENIFRLKSTTSSGISVVGNWYSARAAGDGSFFYEMGRSLYNELDKLDSNYTGSAFTKRNIREDVRYNVNLMHDLPNNVLGTRVLTTYETASQSEYTANDILLIGKYRGMVGSNMVNDIHIFRVADILLAMAEARAAKGQIPSSSTDPNDLIDNRSSVYSILYNIRASRTRSVVEESGNSDYSKVVMPTITDQKSAYAAILNERRMEFAFEGHRYLDMKRLGVKAGSQGFTRYSKDCLINGACNLPANSYKMTLPIPVTEMTGNRIIKAKGQQNPGY